MFSGFLLDFQTDKGLSVSFLTLFVSRETSRSIYLTVLSCLLYNLQSADEDFRHFLLKRGFIFVRPTHLVFVLCFLFFIIFKIMVNRKGIIRRCYLEFQNFLEADAATQKCYRCHETFKGFSRDNRMRK
jgi:hypothetical protein